MKEKPSNHNSTVKALDILLTLPDVGGKKWKKGIEQSCKPNKPHDNGSEKQDLRQIISTCQNFNRERKYKREKNIASHFWYAQRLYFFVMKER